MTEDAEDIDRFFATQIEAAVEAGHFRSAVSLLQERTVALHDWWSSGRLSAEQLRPLLTETWTKAHFPLARVGERAWVRMFKAAGFITDSGRPAPEHDLIVYRGAPLQTRGLGMSWSFDAETAGDFAYQSLAHGPAGTYRAVVPPRAVLAIFEQRRESEVVVNPNMLRGRVELVEKVEPTEFR